VWITTKNICIGSGLGIILLGFEGAEIVVYDFPYHIINYHF
jgi:hypothetical protein